MLAIVVTLSMTLVTLNAIIDPSKTVEEAQQLFDYVVMGLAIALFAVLGYVFLSVPGAILGVTGGWLVGTIIVMIVHAFGGIA